MTLYLLTERIYRQYSGGDPSDDSGLGFNDVKHMVIDEINRLLKMETLMNTKQFGDETPTNLTIATYNGIAVESYATVQSRALLPAIPISLPMNAGVWWVSPDTQDATRHDQFIPMQVGQWSLIKDFQPMVEGGLLLGNITYELDGKYIIFPTDISSSIENVTIKLVLLNIEDYGDWDLLPLPADYVADINTAVMERLRPTPQKEDDTNDANTQK